MSLETLPFENNANLGVISFVNGRPATAVLDTIKNSDLYYLFSVRNDTSIQARQVLSKLWLDNILSVKQEVFINKKLNSLFVSNIDAFINFTLDGSGFTSKSIALRNYIIKVSQILASARVRYMAIGDSLSAAPLKNLDGSDNSYANFYAKVAQNILKDRVDSGNVIPVPRLIGHLNVQDRTFSYKGNTIPVKGGNGAQSGWANAHYLRHAFRLTGLLDTSTLSGYTPAAVSYYMLGLQGQTGLAFTNTTNQIELIRTTVQGKYTPDYNSIIWDYLKIQSDWSGSSGTYTGSSGQNAEIFNYLESKLDNPPNPFYSKTKARTGGSTNAFSMSIYQDRYKTRDDNDNLLAVGSTAGSKVTNVNAYDVNVPTHVTVEFGENDEWLFKATGDQIAADMIAIGTIINSEYPSIKVGMVTNLRPGTLFPERHSDKGACLAKNVTGGAFKYDLRNSLLSRLNITANNVKTGNIYYVPTYETLFPFSFSNSSNAEYGFSNITVDEVAVSGVHPGLEAASIMGDQIYAWIYYSLLN